MPTRAIPIASLLLATLTAQATFADNAVPIVSGGQSNVFYSQYSTIPDHPTCSGADEIALRIPLLADDLAITLYSPIEDVRLSAQGDRIETGRVCSIRTRHGIDVVDVEIPCPEIEPDEDFERLSDALALHGSNIDVGFAGEATACMTPMGARLLEASWTTTITQAGAQTQYSGTVESDDASRFLIVPENDDPPVVFEYQQNFFEYRTAGQRNQGYQFTLGQSGDQSILRALLGLNGIEVEVDCIPIELQGAEGIELLIGFRVDFAIVNDARQTCTGDTCPRLWKRTHSEISTIARTCAL